AAHAFGDRGGDGALAGGVGAQQLDRRRAAAGGEVAPLPERQLRGRLLRRRQVAGGGNGRDERGEALVVRGRALQEVDDLLVGAQLAGDQRRVAALSELDQPPVPQRPVRGHHVPRGPLEDRERQREGRERPRHVVLGAGAQRPDGGVELGGGAEQQHLL